MDYYTEMVVHLHNYITPEDYQLTFSSARHGFLGAVYHLLALLVRVSGKGVCLSGKGGRVCARGGDECGGDDDGGCPRMCQREIHLVRSARVFGERGGSCQ